MNLRDQVNKQFDCYVPQKDVWDEINAEHNMDKNNSTATQNTA